MTTRMMRRRPLTLLDAIIVGASIALGAWVWDTIPTFIEYHLGLRDHPPAVIRRLDSPALPKGDTPALTLTRWRNVTLNFGQTVLPFATIGAAVATFRHRAGRSRRALRRVGVQTTAVAATLVIISLANEFVLRRFPSLEVGYKHNEFDSIWGSLAVDLGIALAASWAVLAIGGLWRAEPSGTDRLGRALGFAWITYCVLNNIPNIYNS